MKGCEPISIGWWHQQNAALGLVALSSVLVISLLSVMLELM
jgi:hypothetical protein